MSARDQINQAFPPVLTAVMLAAFGVLLALDWVGMARGSRDTPILTIIAATALWLVVTTSGVLIWTT